MYSQALFAYSSTACPSHRYLTPPASHYLRIAVITFFELPFDRTITISSISPLGPISFIAYICETSTTTTTAHIVKVTPVKPKFFWTKLSVRVEYYTAQR